jgi:PAS domain S-box-containing protein
MKLRSFRQRIQPIFGLEHPDMTSRLLNAILTSVLIVDAAVIILRLLRGAAIWSTTVLVLLGMLVLQFILLVMVRNGYVRLATLFLVLGGWAGATFLAWSADGVRDVSLYVYVVIILVAALLTNWQISVTLTILSIVSIWILAVSEANGLRAPDSDSALNIAADLTAVFIVLFLLVHLVIQTVRSSLNAARAGEQKFSSIFRVSPVAIAISSLENGHLIDGNDAYWRLTGMDPTYALGKTAVALGIAGSDYDWDQFVNRLRQQRSLHDPEYTIKTTSGEQRTTLAFYELVDYESEPAIVAMFYDVTEQKQTQLALQASEQKYRNFVEQSMQGIWFLAFDRPISLHLPAEEQAELIYKYGYVSECNDVLARMYGYESGEEMRGTRLLTLQTDGNLDQVNYLATLKLVREGYRSANRETRERTRDGRVVYFLNNAVGVVENDRLLGLWGTQLDITALKNTEDALRRSEARTHALLDALPDMIFEFTRDGTIIQFISSSVNKPLIPPKQFLGKPIQEVLPEVADQTMFAIERVLESGQVHAFEYQLEQDHEKKTFEARIAPLSSDTALAIVRDVSLQKWILGEREKLINETESKNAELERFTYTVSHDLKSPLITIKGFLGYLYQDAKTGNLERLGKDIQRISDAADKMQLLLNDLLELSRVGRLVNPPERIDLNQMVTEVLELLHGRIHGGAIPIRIVVDPNLPPVYGDRPRLFEVLQNLIDNAAKFMVDQPDPVIEIGQKGITEAGVPILFVRDNGMGIDPQFKNRIFGLFDKLDPRTDGTGIGLALAKRIIEFHGGSIWVESEPKKGATFYFTLPHSERAYRSEG